MANKIVITTFTAKETAVRETAHFAEDVFNFFQVLLTKTNNKETPARKTPIEIIDKIIPHTDKMIHALLVSVFPFVFSAFLVVDKS